MNTIIIIILATLFLLLLPDAIRNEIKRRRELNKGQILPDPSGHTIVTDVKQKDDADTSNKGEKKPL